MMRSNKALFNMNHWLQFLSLVLVTAILNSGCAVVPKVSETFERPTCSVYQNPLTLNIVPLEFDCGGADIRSCLLGYVAVGPATALASGSIVLAGNGLYWLGNRSHCSIKAYARRSLK